MYLRATAVQNNRKVPEKFLKEFTWAVFVGIRERRFVRVPVYSRMYEFSVAAGKAVAYFSERGEPLQDDKRASKQTDSRNESLLNDARHRILQPVSESRYAKSRQVFD